MIPVFVFAPYRVLAKLLLEHTVTPYRLSVPLLKHLLNMRKFCKYCHSCPSTLMFCSLVSYVILS
jgi:hypothetical protein